MARLSLEAVLELTDRISEPLRRITGASEQVSEALNEQQQALRNLNRQQSQINNFRLLNNELGQTRTALQQAQQQAQRLAQTYAQTANPTRAMTRELEQARNAVRQLQQEERLQVSHMNNLRRALREAGINTQNLSQAERELRANIERGNAELQRRQQRLQQIRQAQERYQQAQERIARLEEFRNNSAVKAVAGSAMLLAPVAEFAQAENAAMSLKVSMMDATGKVAPEFEKINVLAERLGTSLPGSSAEFNAMMSKLVQQGISFQDILGGVGEASANLAVVMQMPFEQAAEFSAKMQDATKTQAKDMLGLMDMIQKSYYLGVDSTNMLGGFSKIADGMKTIRMEGLAGAKAMAPLLVMADQASMDGSSAGNAFSKIFKAMFDVSKIEKTLKKNKANFSMDFTDGKGEFGGLDNMFKQFEKLKGLSTEARLPILSDIFGNDAETIQALNLLIDKGKEGYEETIQKMEQQANLQQRVQAQLGTLANIWDAAKGTFSSALANFGEAIAPQLKSLLETITNITEKVATWAKANPQLAGTIMAMVATFTLLFGALSVGALVITTFLGPLALLRVTLANLGIANAVAMISRIGTAFTWLMGIVRGVAMFFMANPILIAIGLIATAVYLIYRNWGQIAPFFTNLWNRVKAGAMALWQSLKSGFASAMQAIIAIISAFSPVGIFIRAFSAVKSYLAGLGAQFASYGRNLMQGLANGITQSAGQALSKAIAVANSIKSSVKSAFGINSPSKVFHQYGVWNMQGLAQGIDKMAHLPQNSVVDASQNMLTAMNTGTIKWQHGSALQPKMANAGVSQPSMQTFNIYASEGMNEQELARLVAMEVAKINRINEASQRRSYGDYA